MALHLQPHLLVKATVLLPLTAPLGIMGFAVGHLGNAASSMCTAHVMGITPRLAAPFATPVLSPSPLPKGGVFEREYFPVTSRVKCMKIQISTR